jgi:hypothetical protein
MVDTLRHRTYTEAPPVVVDRAEPSAGHLAEEAS